MFGRGRAFAAVGGASARCGTAFVSSVGVRCVDAFVAGRQDVGRFSC